MPTNPIPAGTCNFPVNFRRTDSALASFRQYRTRHKIRGMRLVRRTDEDGSVRIWMQKTPAKKGGKR